MAVTRLKRKARRNKLTAKKRLQKMALEGTKPVIKNVDVEALKEDFKKAPVKPKSSSAEATGSSKKEEVKAEAAAKAPVKEKKETKKAAPKTEKKEAAPKAEKKEAAPKAEKKPAAKKEDKKEE